MAVIAQRLPVGWIVEQVRAIDGALNVIELRGFCRFPVAQAFRTQPIPWITIEPRLPRAAIRSATTEAASLGSFSSPFFWSNGHRSTRIQTTADESGIE